MGLVKLKRALAAAILSSLAFSVYADDAPVYEVDNYPPPFDGQALDVPSPVDAPASSYSGGLAPAEVSSSAAPSLAAPRESYAAPSSQPTPPPPPLTLNQRIQRAEQQIKNLQQSSTLAKADELQKEVQSLRGQVEDMSHQLQQAQTQLKAMYADLDKRLVLLQASKASAAAAVNATDHDAGTALKTAVVKSTSKSSTKHLPTSVAAPVVSTGSHVQPNAAEEQQIYQTAYDLIKAKKYNDAIATLQKMLQRYPTGPTAANAHYWLGELYGLLNKNEQSASEFSLVVKKFPNSSKASDAQLKLGLIYAGQFKWTDAKTAFKGVVKQYPGTASARLATEQLKQIKKAGH